MGALDSAAKAFTNFFMKPAQKPESLFTSTKPTTGKPGTFITNASQPVYGPPAPVKKAPVPVVTGPVYGPPAPVKKTLAKPSVKAQTAFDTFISKGGSEQFRTEQPLPDAAQTTTRLSGAPAAQSMEFRAGEGLSNVTDVKPGPRVSTLKALSRGEDINVTQKPTRISEVGFAKETLAKESSIPQTLLSKAKEEVQIAANRNAPFAERVKSLETLTSPGIDIPVALAREAVFRPLASIGLGAYGLFSGANPEDVSVEIPKDAPQIVKTFLGDRPVKVFGQEMGVDLAKGIVERSTGQKFDARDPKQLASFLPLAMLGSLLEAPGLPGKKQAGKSILPFVEDYLLSTEGKAFAKTSGLAGDELRFAAHNNLFKTSPEYQAQVKAFVQDAAETAGKTTPSPKVDQIEAPSARASLEETPTPALKQTKELSPTKRSLQEPPRIETPVRSAEPPSGGSRPYDATTPQRPPRVKERGFIETMSESPNVSKETIAKIEALPNEVRYYDVYTDKAALGAAQARVAGAGRESAQAYVMSAQALDKDVATTGIELARIYAAEGKHAAEASLLLHLAELGTKSGQGSQALSILNKLSPEGWLMTAAKRVQEGTEAGGKSLSRRAVIKTGKQDVEAALTLSRQADKRMASLKKAADELKAQADELALKAKELKGKKMYEKAKKAKAKADEAYNKAVEASKIAERAAADVADKTHFLGKLDKRALASAGKRGALSDDLAAEIRRRAEEINKMEYGHYKVKKVGELSELIDRHVPKTRGQRINVGAQETLNTFRTMMAGVGIDFSFALRQGIMPFFRNPKTWLRSFKEQFRAVRSEAGYDAVMDEIYKSKYFSDAVESGVSFTDVNAKLMFREERYMSSLAEKVPLLGRNIRANARAYTAMANKLRIETFSSLMQAAKSSGNPVSKETAQGFARLVNASTGRGEYFEVMKGAAPFLNAVFFSPRLIAARAHFLNPWNYIRAARTNPKLAKEYLKSVVAYTTGVTTILALADLHPDVDVGLDWRSADFAKIRVGNTRFDISGGFQPWIRFIAQISTGKYVNSSTGKVITLGEGYKALTKKDIGQRFLESKLSPPFSLSLSLLEQQNPDGSKVKLSSEIGERVTPMIMSDLWDIYQENPQMVPAALMSGIFGVGVQSYAPPEAYVKLEELKKMDSEEFNTAWKTLKKENPALAEKVDRAGTESTFNEFDWSLTYMGVEDGTRAKYLYERLQKMPADESSALYQDLRTKKLISERVDKQLDYLYKAKE